MNEEFRIICDGGSLRIYKGNYGFNFEEIVDLLNEQQATIHKLRNENIILKNKIEDLRGGLIIQNELLQRQMQKSDLDE